MTQTEPTPRRWSSALEFWGVLVGPWVLDMAGGRGLFASLFGALLWGFAVILAALRPLTKDESFRKKQGWALAFVLGAWIAYWVLAFFETPRRLTLEAGSLHMLTWLHAAFLTAGVGMVVVLALAAMLWLVQDSSLRRSSWERRQHGSVKLPSLESLGAMARRSSQLAFSFWGLGLFFAIVTAMIRWPIEIDRVDAGKPAGLWWLDTKVVTALVLWLLLAALFQLGLPNGAGNSRWRYRAYVVISGVFTAIFAWLMLGGYSEIHGPLSWFVQ